MAIASGRLGSRGLTLMHVKEASEIACLEDGSTNMNFISDFSAAASLLTVSITCSTYEVILDVVHEFNAFGQEMWYDHMRKVTSRLLVLVAKNKSAYPDNTPARVRLTLLYANMFHGTVLGHLQADDPQWAAPPRQTLRPPNDGSAWAWINVFRKNIRKEQEAWRWLVLDKDLLEQWPEIVISPFGVVDKGNEDATSSGRTIHDLSFPEGSSINECTDQDSITKPDYRHFYAVATEIPRAKYNHPGTEIHVMAGDVASAFRNITIHSNRVYLFAGLIEEENVLIIELSVPFGWPGSPGFFEIFGGAISHIHGSHMNTICPTGYFNYHWVDDHINVTANIGSSCREMDRSLRFVIVAILGADAINDKKFTVSDVGIEMYASDFGLCVLDIPAHKALTYQFTAPEGTLIRNFKNGEANGFDINYRWLLSCAFAVQMRGSRWAANVPRNGRPLHVPFRIDNTSAVT
ncbi:Secreted protein [Phytophthora palmivora]|uniref:Secreted protein n=1 Tax=Phytophthora palmivora TaxID=4796 RepID=A0A2P4XEM8_9STRA|nr:Secreted protein [Phytophthora palmivora]